MKFLSLIFVFALILSLAFISAPEEVGVGEEPMEDIKIPIEPLEDKAGWTIDNIYSFDDKISLGKAQITSSILWIIPFDPIEDIELKENTFVCGQYCSAEKEITIYKDTKLVDSVIFKTIQEDGSEVEQPIRNYKFEIRSKHVVKEVEDYTYSCDATGDYHVNGTAVVECSDKLTGTHIAYDDTWIPYNYEVMPSGTYYLRLSGEKKPSRSVEFYIIAQGRFIDEWATWGATPSSAITEAHGQPQATDQSYLNAGGMAFEAKEDLYLMNVTIKDGCGATWLTLWDSTSNTLMMRATLYGANASFYNDTYKAILYKGRNYTVEAYKGGAGFNQKRGSGTFPVDQTHIRWVGASQATGGDYSDNQIPVIQPDGTNNVLNIESVTTALIQNSAINLTSPANEYASNNQIITFISNATQFGATLVNMSLWTNATGTWARNITIYNTSNTVVFDAMGLNNGVKVGGVVINSTFAKFGLGGAELVASLNQSLTLGNFINISNNNPFTLCSWIKPIYNGSSNAQIFAVATTLSGGSTSSFRFVINNGGANKTLASIFNSSGSVNTQLTGTHALNIDSWNLACWGYNGTNMTTSVNDNPISYGSSELLNTDGSTFLSIGKRIGTSNYYNGQLDEVRIFNRTLSQAEITSLYTSNTISDTTGLVSYYNFDTEGNTANLGSSYTWTQPVTFADGGYKWGVQACDSDGDCAFSNENRTFTIDSIAPTVNIIYPTGTLNGLTNGQSLGLNYTIGGTPQACGYEYEGANTTIANCAANTTFTYSSGVNSIILWANDSFGNYGSDTNTWASGITLNSLTWNASTYETFTEGFVANISNATSASLVLDGTAYASTVSGQLVSNSVSIPLGAGNKSFYYKINGGTFNSSLYYQRVLPLTFGICNASNTLNYINLTFKDETTNTPLNATMNPAEVIYWINSASLNKTFLFTNTTESIEYAFCFDPGYKTLNHISTFNYAASGYPQRKYVFSNPISNITTNQVLYLLGSGDGIYTTFQTTNTLGSIVTGVDILMERQIGGNWTTISQATSDGAGTATFWVNPNYQYRFTFTKTDCTSSTNTLYPTQTQYTQALSCGGTTSTEAFVYVTQVDGITFAKYPPSGVTYPGMYNFTFDVYSARNNLVNIRMDLVNLSGSVLNSTSKACSNATLCGTSFRANLSNGYNMKGRYYVDIGQGYILIDADAYWRFISSNTSTTGTVRDFIQNFRAMFFTSGEDTELCGQYTSLATCEAANCKYVRIGGDDTSAIMQCIPNDRVNKQEYSRIVIIFLFMCIGIAALNKFTGVDSAYPGMATYFVGALIFLGSAAGGLTGQGLFYYDGLFGGESAAGKFMNNYALFLFSLLLMWGHYFSVRRRYT